MRGPERMDRSGFLGGRPLGVGLMASRKALPRSCGNAVAMVFESRAETGNARGSIARVGQRAAADTNRY